MFKSIQWKLVIIYFLLVWLAMSIIGVYISEAEKKHQINNMTKMLTLKADSLSDIIRDKMAGAPNIQEQIDIWLISQSKQIKTVLVLNSNGVPVASGGDLVTYPIYDEVIARALAGQREISSDDAGDYKRNYKSIAIPIISPNNELQGAIYMIADMSEVNESLENIKSILTTATIWALCVTVLLGTLLAKTITGPIKEVTTKAEMLAKGDFGQIIPVKSDDEIGQLTEMFNFLTIRLKDTLDEMYSEKNKVETILTHMTDGVIAVNASGTVLHANPAAFKLLNVDKDEIKDTRFDDIMNSLKLEISTKDLFEGIQLNNSLISVGKNIIKFNMVSFNNEKNEAAGAILVLQDVTEQERLDRMRKEFVANVSHELRTPLTTIKSYTETLLDGALDSKELSVKFLKVIDSESDRMTRLVKDLLQLSRLDYDKTQWNMRNINISHTVEDCVYKMDMSAQQKNQTLSFEGNNEIVEIEGDKDRMEQVIINILSNAIKYTPENGIIKVSLERQMDHVLIKVVDNGIGIPKEDLPRLFERFYRVDKARSRMMGGTGLGLSIAKQIVEAHNGEIKINSEYGKGTCVIISIKLHEVVD